MPLAICFFFVGCHAFRLSPSCLGTSKQGRAFGLNPSPTQKPHLLRKGRMLGRGEYFSYFDDLGVTLQGGNYIMHYIDT